MSAVASTDFPKDIEFLTLELAVEVCRVIESALAPIGYHCGLTGGCLYRGLSGKDVDVIVYPHQVSKTRSKDALKDALKSVGILPMFDNGHGVSCRDKDIELFKLEDVRIDLFFLK